LNKQKLYLLSLSVVFLGSVMLLQFFNEAYLERYFALFTVAYLIVTLVINPRRRWFDIVGVIMSIGFSYIIFAKLLVIVPQILSS
jgi:hypothetical protein